MTGWPLSEDARAHNALRKATRQPCRKKLVTLLDVCVSSLRRGHANHLCIVPILTDDPRRESERARGTRLDVILWESSRSLADPPPTVQLS